jgi:hypothetical protein
LSWDKADPDTWRVRTTGPGPVTVRFDYLADTLDNAMAWSRPDFLLFNGTNVFPYPEGRGFDFPATVTVKTQPSWLVATSMKPAAAPGVERGELSRPGGHALLHRPLRLTTAWSWTEKTTRLASYPSGILKGETRAALWDQIAKAIPRWLPYFRRRRGTPTR